jgi:hypothetical protein
MKIIAGNTSIKGIKTSGGVAFKNRKMDDCDFVLTCENESVITQIFGGIKTGGEVVEYIRKVNSRVPVSEAITISKSVIKYSDVEVINGKTSSKIDPCLILAQLQSESSFNKNARSNAGAVGIAQFIKSTGAAMGLVGYKKSTKQAYDYRTDIELSVQACCRLMKSLIKGFGSVELALAAYNAGGGAVRKYNGIPPYKETINYVKIIMSRWKKIRAEIGK